MSGGGGGGGAQNQNWGVDNEVVIAFTITEINYFVVIQSHNLLRAFNTYICDSTFLT